MSVKPCLSLIVATAVPCRGIGASGTLPWRLRREMKYFREVTAGGIVIMGRKTWESIPPKFRPLKGRVNVVISSNPSSLDLPTATADDEQPCLGASSLDDALDKIQTYKSRPVFVIGGAQLYNAALNHPQTSRILLTEIKRHSEPWKTSDFDVFFPSLAPERWKKASLEELRESVGAGIDVPEIVQEDGYEYEFTLLTKLSDKS